jgi:hypothetical protein
VHYPTDGSLLQDGVSVLARTMQRASAAMGDRRGRVLNRQRSDRPPGAVTRRPARPSFAVIASDVRDLRRRAARRDDGATDWPATADRQRAASGKSVK